MNSCFYTSDEKSDGTTIHNKNQISQDSISTSDDSDNNREIYILLTGDIHSSTDQDYGFDGVRDIRNELESKGCTTFLVDSGDAIEWNADGTLYSGEKIIDEMNALGYDVAVPGNHEFMQGPEYYSLLVKRAEFSYICCNYSKAGETFLAPYIIKDAGNIKIAFVGITTPMIYTSYLTSKFTDDTGKSEYDFMQDETGDRLYTAVQNAVEAARNDGADYVYAIGHLGNEDACKPWRSEDVIANTTGIDVFLDGHSHDTDKIIYKNKSGNDVTRIAAGSMMNAVGYSHISSEGGIMDTDIWIWNE